MPEVPGERSNLRGLHGAALVEARRKALMVSSGVNKIRGCPAESPGELMQDVSARDGFSPSESFQLAAARVLAAVQGFGAQLSCVDLFGQCSEPKVVKSL